MNKTEVVKTVCGFCGSTCGMLVTLDNGVPVKVGGDPENPVNRGGLCRTGQAALDYLNSPHRLTHPRKRAGERGEGKWTEISWDEALRYSGDQLNRIKNDHGPHSVMVVHGAAKPVIDTMAVRFANVFGTPNVVCSDHVCHIPHMLAAEYTFGYSPGPDVHGGPECIITWGTNREETGLFRHREVIQAHKKGSCLIAIDPLKTSYAAAAEHWLQLKPGTDLALALGFLNVIVTEELYDHEFVGRYTVGFEQLADCVTEYIPEKVSEYTWVDADLIRKAARLYAQSKPACICWGNGLDQSADSFQAGRAIAILMSITGNLDIAGGEVQSRSSGFRWCDVHSDEGHVRGRWSAEMEQRNRITPEQRQKKVSAGLLSDFRYVTPDAVTTSVLEGKPYRIRGAFVQASNPLSSWNNVRRTYDAFKQLEFLAVSEFFMTPTAALADIVFPSSTFLESDAVRVGPGGSAALLQRKVAQVGHCRPDYEIINELAKTVGMAADFWNSSEDLWDYILQPSGVNYQEFCSKGIIRDAQPRRYKKYLQEGFFTPTGKVELFSEQLAAMGFDPVPVYRPSYSAVDCRVITEAFDLFCTCRKVTPYQHSSGRQIEKLRNGHPFPLVMIHPDTAQEREISDGDWVHVQSKNGITRMKASLTSDVHRNVVISEHAWWFPEKGPDGIYGFAESNYNALTCSDVSNAEVGSFVARGIACRVYKA